MAITWMFFCGIIFPIYAQKLAVITPQKNEHSENIVSQFSKQFKLLDTDLVTSAVNSTPYENFYNLSTEEAKILGKVIGCDYFIVLKAENLRRASLVKPTYFESYAVVYVVSAKTGRLVFWTLKSLTDETPTVADKQLYGSIESLSAEIKRQIAMADLREKEEITPPNLEELPDESSPEAKNFQSPLPFKRFVPVYKRIANLYSIAATVDAIVDLDKSGQITRIEITRWAGYELDEAVIEVIRKMNWRPASRNGKTLPIRVLLRYNFKKVEKEE